MSGASTRAVSNALSCKFYQFNAAGLYIGLRSLSLVVRIL